MPSNNILLELYDQVEQATSNDTFDCQKGCAHCCHLPVPATLPELLPIVSLLKQNKHLREKVDHPAKACPFLDERNTCLIYANRPFHCRAYVSMQKAFCEERLQGAEDHALRIPSEIRKALTQARHDYRQSLRDQGKDAREYRMVDTLKVLLTHGVEGVGLDLKA